jgi:glycogen(starch) synthase
VLLWAGSFLPRIGGVEVVVDGLVRSLPSLGVELRVIAPAEAGAPAEELHAGVPVHRFPFREALAARDVRSIARIRRRIAEITQAFAPDVAHLHAFHPGFVFHLQTSAAGKARRLVTLHGWPKLSYGPETVAGRLLRTADRVTSCSAAILALARRRIPAIRRVSSVIPNGVPPGRDIPTPLPFDPPRILCLGRLVPEKGFDLAVAAVAALGDRTPRPELVVAGDGPERAALEAAVAARGLSGRTAFTGWIAPGAVPPLVNQCTLVVIPSREESFGLVAVEAGRMARPVVAAAVGGLPEVVRSGRTGLLVPGGDSGALARGIGEILDHPDVARRLGAAGRRRAHRSFGLARQAARYARVYRALVKERVHG